MTYNEYCNQDKCDLECACKTCIKKISQFDIYESEHNIFVWSYCSNKQFGSHSGGCKDFGVKNYMNGQIECAHHLDWIEYVRGKK